MMEKLEYDEFAGMFGAWAELFKPFIESKEMFDIYKTLKADASKETIVPSSDNVFRAFATTSPETIKSIWYLMDPYPRKYNVKVNNVKINQATGIAMDCSNSPDGKMQPSLELFYEGMQDDLKEEVERSLSLEYLHQQGVMMLNTDLTCKLNKTGSHSKLWEPFQKFFLEEIMGKKRDIIYVLAGSASHRMERYIMPISNGIFRLEHPMAAGHKNTTWNHKNIFSTINKLLTEMGDEPIIWDKKQWDEQNDPPF